MGRVSERPLLSLEAVACFVSYSSSSLPLNVYYNVYRFQQSKDLAPFWVGKGDDSKEEEEEEMTKADRNVVVVVAAA